MRFLFYQILIIGVIWGGMFYYLDDLYDQGRIIFYIVTSWFLLLIVLFIKEWIRSKKNPEDKK